MKNDTEIITYNVRLNSWFRRDGRAWLAWCPSIDVRTQARTKKGALEALREAVQLWFESCIERDVLDAALKEVGFEEVSLGEGEETLPGSNSIQIQRLLPEMEALKFHFSLNHSKGSSFIEGTIPAYMAAQQLGNSARALC